MSNIKCEYCGAVYDSKTNNNICPACGARNEQIEKSIPLSSLEEHIKESVKKESQKELKKEIKKEKARKKKIVRILVVTMIAICLLFINMFIIFNKEESLTNNNKIEDTNLNEIIVPYKSYKIKDAIINLEENEISFESIIISPTNELRIFIESYIKVPDDKNLSFALIDTNGNEYVLPNLDINKDIFSESYSGYYYFNCENIDAKILETLTKLKISINEKVHYFDLIDYTSYEELPYDDNSVIPLSLKHQFNDYDYANFSQIILYKRNDTYKASITACIKCYLASNEIDSFYVVKNNKKEFHSPKISFYLINKNGVEYKILSNEFYNYEKNIEEDMDLTGKTVFPSLEFDIPTYSQDWIKIKMVIDDKEYINDLIY